MTKLSLPQDWPAALEPERLRQIQREAVCLVDPQAVGTVYDQLAETVAKDLSDQVPVVLCVMNGALYFGAALLARWSFLLELDYVHVTRYGDETSGGELKWLSKARINLADRTVLVVDDIFDEGVTLQTIVEDCRALGAAKVVSCVLVEKQHQRKSNDSWRPDYVGLQVPDEYVFGCGMDYKGFFRNLPGIYALPARFL